ncbi:MAG: hypothetical protein K0U08_06905 [Proteobacteria bacterium]|nr:hypothetical protein [Pseudomonadota bacterium]
MANPFFIDSKIGESLVGLGNVIGDKYEKEQALEEEARLKQAEFEKQQAMQSELQSAMASGDENQIAAVSMKYPQLSEKIQETFKFKNDITKQNFLDSAKEIISGGDVEQVLQTRVEQVQSQGGDPTDTLRELEMYRANPEGYVDKVKKAYILADPKGFKEYQAATAEKTTKFEQGTGDMTGYAFNPETGEYKINPQLKSKIEEIKSKPTLSAKDRQSINKDFTQLTKDTKLIRNTASDLEKLGEIKSGPASIAMVFKFMKALDPTSVVREGEFATAENSAGIPETVRNTYNKIMEGGRLGDEQIKNFVSTAKQLANNSIESSNTEVQGFVDTFEDTLPKSFKKLLINRIPKKFEIESQVEATESGQQSSVPQAPSKYTVGQTATNPQTGETLVFTAQGWVKQ